MRNFRNLRGSHAWGGEGYNTYWLLRVVGSLLLAYVVTGVYSCDELRYSGWGQRAAATVEQATPSLGTGRYDLPGVQVTYRFVDAAGVAQRGGATYPVGSTIAVGDQVEVVYILHEKFSDRPVALRRAWAAMVFLGLTLLVAAGVALLGFNVARDIREMERKDRARKARP
ncbi:MAG: hypothetical protein NTW19_16300 [Planctomycetota bacterium]|nr:hypothetical protein [Planctomycetota bacterium]